MILVGIINDGKKKWENILVTYTNKINNINNIRVWFWFLFPLKMKWDTTWLLFWEWRCDDQWLAQTFIISDDDAKQKLICALARSKLITFIFITIKRKHPRRKETPARNPVGRSYFSIISEAPSFMFYGILFKLWLLLVLSNLANILKNSSLSFLLIPYHHYCSSGVLSYLHFTSYFLPRQTYVALVWFSFCLTDNWRVS